MAIANASPQYSDLPPGAVSLPGQSAQPQYNDLPPGAVSVPDQQTSDQDTVWGGVKKAVSDAYSVASGFAPPTNTQAATTIPGKALGMAEDVMTGINNLAGVTAVTDSLKTAGHMIHAYETSRASGGSIMDGLHAANERAKQADAITPMILQRGRRYCPRHGGGSNTENKSVSSESDSCSHGRR